MKIAFHAVFCAIMAFSAVFAEAHDISNEKETTPMNQPPAVERWGMSELVFHVENEPEDPFRSDLLRAEFRREDGKTFSVAGFYDGNRTYRIRFSPDQEGLWHWKTSSSLPELNEKNGSFLAVAPSKDNHGPVRTTKDGGFEYADGTECRLYGTTCYVWLQQPEPLRKETLETLKNSPFNKIRFCVFPKWYVYNRKEPELYPYEGTPPNHWNFSRFNPEYFRILEEGIASLQKLGIEADVILFHPYDEGHWGFDRMPPEANDEYLKYVVARFAAYRNVWWSFANEYDFMTEKTPEDWKHFIRLVAQIDPYGRLRSIHNGIKFYDQGDPLLTHASVQYSPAVEEPGRASFGRMLLQKPVMMDEVRYEGDIPQGWGCLSPEEETLRFWRGFTQGVYVTHGETYRSDDGVLWWSHGGKLKGESPKRIAFLRKYLEESAPRGMPRTFEIQGQLEYATIDLKWFAVYFGRVAPPQSLDPHFWMPGYDETLRYDLDLVDTWNMTVETLRSGIRFVPEDGKNSQVRVIEGGPVSLPQKPYLALVLRPARNENAEIRK